MKLKHRRAARLLGREGLSKVETAKRCGVVEKVIYDWLKLPGFQELMAKEAEKSLSILDAAADEVDKTLVNLAKVEDFRGSKDRRLYYQLRGLLVEKWKGEIDPLVIVRARKGEKEESEG